MTPPPSFSQVFSELRQERKLSPLVARRVFDSILAGGWTPIQIGAFLSALSLIGESASVIGAAAKSMRDAMIPVEHGLPLVFDTCGTGGDGQNTVNLSTGAAIIVAAAGVPVAKHGNRAASSRAGAAEVLTVLGIPHDLPLEAAPRLLKSAGIAFLYARAHHPAMKYAAAPRRELGVPTIFNVLGPLCNPARATRQLVGTYADHLRPLMAEALGALGVERAWVVHSVDGLDEISPFGPTRVSVLSAGKVEEGQVAPEDFGLRRSAPGAIRGGDATTNAGILIEVLSGKSHPARTALVLNAAASLAIARDMRLEQAAALAGKLIDDGAALARLELWRREAQAWGRPSAG